MAVGSRNAVFTFKADISNYVQNGAVLVRTNNGIRKSAQDVSTTLQTTDRQIKTTGQTAASSAVNFQTMTQGMLNLSTAGAQTFTSLSNLDRAANRLMQAQVAQQRGVDLLRNKELRLAQLREKGGADLRKIAALESEVETARADLLVKTDKLRIEEGALNDVRILFVTNIANVMISSLQTINTLRTMEIRQTITSAGAKIKDAFAARIMTQAYSKAPAAINATRFSLRGLLLTLGPIGLAITGIAVAMQAWEENWGGFRDTLQSVFPFLRDLEKDVLPGVRDETDALIDSTTQYSDAINGVGDAIEKLTIPHKNYLKMMREAAEQIGNNNLALEYQAQLIGKTSQGFSTPSVGGGQPITETTSAQQGVTTGGTGTTASTAQPTTPKQEVVTTGGTPLTNATPDPFGTPLGKVMFKNLNVKEKHDQLIRLSQQAFDEGRTGASAVYLDEALKIENEAEAFKEPKEITPMELFEQISTKQTSLKPLTIQEKISQILKKVDSTESGQMIKPSDARLLQKYLKDLILTETTPEFFGTNTGNAFLLGQPPTYLTRNYTFSDETNAVLRQRGIEYLYNSQSIERRNQLGGLGLFQSPDMPGFFFSGLSNGPQDSRVQNFYRMTAAGRSILDRQNNLRIAYQRGIRDFGRNVMGAGTTFSNAVTNAEQLEAMGATSALPGAMAFGAAAISRGMVSVSETGGMNDLDFLKRFGRRNVLALRARRLEIMAEDAYRRSTAGVAEILGRRRNQFASDFYFERYAGGESPITQRQSRAISGYFGPGEADKALFKAIVGVNEIPNLPVGVQALMKIRRAFTEPTRGPGGHAFQTFMKRMGERHRQQNTFLRTAVTRFEGGNFGEFEATSLYGLSSHTANVLSSEIDSEQRVFQERFGTPLGMDYNTFAQVMSTAQRGLSEMEDRLRWNQRLDSISTGATVI